MAKYYGEVGYGETVETSPGVWVDQITERPYYGDVERLIRRSENGDQVNNDISVNNQISIVADPYAFNHFFAIRYIKWAGEYWKVPTVEVRRPRLYLTIGGVYDGEKAATPSNLDNNNG